MSKYPLVENPIIVSGLVPDYSDVVALKSMSEYYLDSFLKNRRIAEEYTVKKANEKVLILMFEQRRYDFVIEFLIEAIDYQDKIINDLKKTIKYYRNKLK